MTGLSYTGARASKVQKMVIKVAGRPSDCFLVAVFVDGCSVQGDPFVADFGMRNQDLLKSACCLSLKDIGKSAFLGVYVFNKFGNNAGDLLDICAVKASVHGDEQGVAAQFLGVGAGKS